MPVIWDFIMVILFAVALPAYGLYAAWQHRDTSPDDDPAFLQKSYQKTILFLWGLAVLALTVWAFQGRNFNDLGLNTGQASYAIWVWFAVAAASFLLFAQSYRAGTNHAAAQSIMTSLEKEDGVKDIMPRTPEDYRLFKIVSVTAGITEEILYRGFLIWFLSAWLPLWVAAGVSVVVFVLGHLYQKSITALAQVAGIAVLLTLVYLFSGSLLPAILLHIVIDLAGNATVWRARQLVAQ